MEVVKVTYSVPCFKRHCYFKVFDLICLTKISPFLHLQNIFINLFFKESCGFDYFVGSTNTKKSISL